MELQKCLAGSETSPDFPSAGGRRDYDWIFIFWGWTHPLKRRPPPPAEAVKRFLHLSASVIKQIKGEIKISVLCADLFLPSWLLRGLYSRAGSDVLRCILCVTAPPLVLRRCAVGLLYSQREEHGVVYRWSISAGTVERLDLSVGTCVCHFYASVNPNQLVPDLYWTICLIHCR